MSNTTTLEEILSSSKENMSKSIESLNKEFSKIQTGRANPAILENLRVDYFDQPTPINQLANIGLQDQMITITAWEKRMLPEIEKVILKANLGLTPQNDGNLIRIIVPPLTTERRNEMVKVINKISEDYKTSIRNLRREANQQIKGLDKQDQLSEDEVEKATNNVQKITDKFIEEITTATKEKEQQLLSN